MDILVYFYRANEFDSPSFIGCCESVYPFIKVEEFERKIDSLCKAMDWNRKLIESIRCYPNNILDRFPIL